MKHHHVPRTDGRDATHASDFVDVVALHHGLVLVGHEAQKLVHVAVAQRDRVRLQQLRVATEGKGGTCEALLLKRASRLSKADLNEIFPRHDAGATVCKGVA